MSRDYLLKPVRNFRSWICGKPHKHKVLRQTKGYRPYRLQYILTNNKYISLKKGILIENI